MTRLFLCAMAPPWKDVAIFNDPFSNMLDHERSVKIQVGMCVAFFGEIQSRVSQMKVYSILLYQVIKLE